MYATKPTKVPGSSDHKILISPGALAALPFATSKSSMWASCSLTTRPWGDRETTAFHKGLSFLCFSCGPWPPRVLLKPSHSHCQWNSHSDPGQQVVWVGRRFLSSFAKEEVKAGKEAMVCWDYDHSDQNLLIFGLKI